MIRRIAARLFACLPDERNSSLHGPRSDTLAPMSGPTKRKGRALLVASVGVAVTTFGCKNDPPTHVGNLRPVEVYLPDAGPTLPDAAPAPAESASAPKVPPRLPP